MKNAMDSSRKVLVYQTETDLYDAAASMVAQVAAEAVEHRGQFLFVLAGGETPRPLYQRLAQDPALASFPWEHTHLFWGDERAVAPDDVQSNYRMAAKELLQTVSVPQENIHRIRGELGAAAAAREYATELRKMAEGGMVWPYFDLVLLGMGRDGHTASLFPGSTHPSRSGQATLAVTGSYNERATSRVTLTPPVFNSARNILYLVLGKRKAATLANVLEGDKSPVQFPARRIKPERGTLTWYVDSKAASQLTSIPNG